MMKDAANTTTATLLTVPLYRMDFTLLRSSQGNTNRMAMAAGMNLASGVSMAVLPDCPVDVTWTGIREQSFPRPVQRKYNAG